MILLVSENVQISCGWLACNQTVKFKYSSRFCKQTKDLRVDNDIRNIAWVHLTQSFKNLLWQINKSLIDWVFSTNTKGFSIFLWK